jgi:hypothetical protein
LGCGEDGVSETNKLTMCSLSFARTRFLLPSSASTKLLPSLQVVDESKSHGLMSPKVEVVMVEDARELGCSIWGNMAAIEVERKKREDRAQTNYASRLAAYTKALNVAAGDPAQAENSIIKLGRPNFPASKAAAGHNFVARNQRYIMHSRPELHSRYGLFHNCVGTANLSKFCFYDSEVDFGAALHYMFEMQAMREELQY